MKERDTIPILCSLTSAKLREREATLLADFRSAVLETEELQEGFTFRLSGDGKLLKLIAELIVAERECCLLLDKKLCGHEFNKLRDFLRPAFC